MKGDPDMKTLLNKMMKNRLQRAGGLALSVLLALTMLAAAVPQPALAATVCVAHYTVKSGDTTSKIAHTFGLTWAEIAMANHMKAGDRLKVGQSLCIPSKSPSTTQAGMMTAMANGNIVIVDMSGFAARYIWNVNVSDTSKTVSGVFKVGRIIVPANTAVKGAFKLPPELRKTPRLMVCVKNLTTDEKMCRSIGHTL
jgi:LysM repeat protein